MDNAKYLAGEQGVDLDVDNLYVKQALANDGPRMKRIRPAPMGRAFRYQRRLTHIVLSVAEREGKRSLVTKVEEPAAGAKTAKAKSRRQREEGGKEICDSQEGRSTARKRPVARPREF